ncbi:MAG: UDP-N-acetylmuramoyl-L-alanine--D-glutamate ligase [Synechococcales cyanobacterium T60_A2020_003]|nr:UDP-N-acetylmuramoyl-L-alanine--D-glutamate ligase [Synechococcales cyanobacterium T60_A2020_003]
MPHAAIVGLGKSGIGAARLLKVQGWDVWISDRTTSPFLEHLQTKLEAEGIPVRLGHTIQPDPAELDRLVVSPGVPWDLEPIEKARSLGIETLGEMELAWRSLQSWPWVGITGTNGKTTTTALVAAMFQAAGLNAPSCGNIGNAATELAYQVVTQGGRPLDWVIAEVSSYQIESSDTLAPEIGIWTTFTPDHLSRHYTLDNYYAIKASLLGRSRYQVFNGDDPYLRAHAPTQFADACWTSVQGKEYLVANPDRGTYLDNGWVFHGQTPIVQAADLRMVGRHNQQNLLMAAAAACLAGIDPEAIAQAVRTFPGVPHRLEHICTWRGIDFINDSKATNYDAAEVGLAAVAAPAILIAGGDPKAGDDEGWMRQIHAKAAAVLLIGDAAPAFAQRLAETGYTNTEIVETMDRAVRRAAELAPQVGARVVLLSPACASFDQYRSFEQRGDHFRQLCLEQFQD